MGFHAMSVAAISPAERQTDVQSQEPLLLRPSDYVVAIGDVFCFVLLTFVDVVVIVVIVVIVIVVIVVIVVAVART